MRGILISVALLLAFHAYNSFGQNTHDIKPSGKSKMIYVQQWDVAQIELTSTKKYGDPFSEVDVNATFTGPGNQTIIRPAFWDGDNRWLVRFAPTATGLWTMKTSCSDKGNKGLHDIGQLISCQPYTGNLDIYRHGFLKVSENKRYFEYADGTPFFYLGDTHWLYIHERFDTSNVPGVPSQFKYVVDKRVGQGFTVYQTEAIQHPHGQNSSVGGGSHAGMDEEPHCNFRDGFDEKDIAAFRNIDRKFKYIADKGLVNANSAICWALDPAEFPASYSETYLYKLGKYWAARYGAYPVLWTIAQEIDKNMYGKYDSISINKWFAVAKAIYENDGYHHPLTAHMENTSSTIAGNSWWIDKPYHTWWGVQWQESVSNDMMTVGRNFWNSPVTEPSVLYESAYEGFWTDAKGARSAGYKAFQCGMYGYGYGANGVWNDLYSKDPPDYGTDYEMPVRFLSWYDGANLPGAGQLSFLKSFYIRLHWWKLTPRFDDSVWSALVDRIQCFVSSDEQKTYVVYFANRVTSTGDLKNLAIARTYAAKWYNPRNGAYTNITTFKTETGRWIIPDKPDSDDWVLWVDEME